MRKITREALQAFINREPFRKSNTSVHVTRDGVVYLMLFGNIIAKLVGDRLCITLAGWPTNTTKERLNALPGVHIHQLDGVWYLNGVVWDGNWVEIGQLSEL